RVTLTFASAERLPAARAEVTERLLRVALPKARRPELGADVAPGDDGLRYTLRGAGYTVLELYAVNEQLRSRLLGVPAIADVSTCGGSRRRLKIIVDAARASRSGVALRSLLDAIAPPEPARPAASLRELTPLVVGMADGVPVRVLQV